MIKPGHYTDLLRQVNELKRQLHLVEAERKACDDEGSETIKANQQRLNRLKLDVTDLKLELADAARNQRAGHPLQSCHMGGILHVLKDNGIDISKYRSSATSEEILKDLDNRIADLVKHADLAKFNVAEIYQRINELDEQMAARRRSSSPSDGLSTASSSSPTKLVSIKTKRQQQQQKETDESTLTEMQNVKQKMAEALHIQRQYKTILDVMQTEKISHERQLIELEKSIADAKNEAEKLKEVRESARRSRDGARMELQHHEETLVASTRETDRLLSEYKRRIDEMKSSAGNPALRKTAALGQPTQHPSNQQASASSSKAEPSSATAGNTRSHHLGLASAGPPIASPSGAASTTSDALAEQDPSEQAALVEAKKAIDHLKSVTGASDIRSMIQIVESQREKCDELRQQFHVLQERQAYLTQLKETLQARYKQLRDAQAQLSSSSDKATPRLIDELFDETHQPTPKTFTSRNNEQSSITASDVFSYLIASVTKICSQIPFGPPMDEQTSNEQRTLAKIGTESGAGSGQTSPTQLSNAAQSNAANNQNGGQQQASGVSLINQLDALLTLLENKLAALTDLVKSLNAIKAEPSATVANDMSSEHELIFTGNQVLRGADSAGRLPPHQIAATVARPTVAAAAAAAGKLARVDSASDEDQVPTRGYLKRQTRIIVEAKTKKQTNRPRKGD